MGDIFGATTVLGSDESVVRETSNVYDYRGRRISHIENEDETQYSYGDGVSVLETKGAKTTLFYRGSDQGGGVGGINYAEYSDGSELNYKMYNLRGDVIATYGSDKSLKSAYMYNPFGTKETRYGDIKTDSHRANTKVEDSGNLLNEGKRFRHLEYGIFLTPDPLEYVDGYNPYIYCGQNPWGKWDPLGLFGDGETYQEYKKRLKEVEEKARKKPTYFNIGYFFLVKKSGQIKGHSNFTGSDKFDFTKEDHDRRTSPFNPFSTERHFRDIEQTEKEIAEAINSLNKEAFERAMHRGQDYFSHYSKGYRWDPVNGKFGHIQDGEAPDRDKKAWSDAEKWTKKWLDKWNEAVKKKESEKDSKKKDTMQQKQESDKNSSDESSSSQRDKPKEEKENND